MTVSRDWTTYEGHPGDTEYISDGANQIRLLKVDIRERGAIDHYWGTSTAKDGQHKQVTLNKVASDPAYAALMGFIYTKDVGSGVIELFYEDAAGNVTQVSSGGVGFVRMTGDQTIAGTKTFSSFPVTPSSAPTTDYEVANKKYVDDQVGAIPGQVGFGSWVDKSASYGAQQAASDGFVVAWGLSTDASGAIVNAFTDVNSNPTTQIGAVSLAETYNGTVTMPVKKGDYWKVTTSGNLTLKVYWIPLGS